MVSRLQKLICWINLTWNTPNIEVYFSKVLFFFHSYEWLWLWKEKTKWWLNSTKKHVVTVQCDRWLSFRLPISNACMHAYIHLTKDLNVLSAIHMWLLSARNSVFGVYIKICIYILESVNWKGLLSLVVLKENKECVLIMCFVFNAIMIFVSVRCYC